MYQFNYESAINSSYELKQYFDELNKLMNLEENPRIQIEQFITELNIELNYQKLNINIKEELHKIKETINMEHLNNNPLRLINMI